MAESEVGEGSGGTAGALGPQGAPPDRPVTTPQEGDNPEALLATADTPQPTEERINEGPNPPQKREPRANKNCCGAQLRKQPGRYCQKPPTPGSKRCRIHGGKTPFGPASPHYKTGLYCKVLPHPLGKMYREQLKDPELLSAREDVALLKVRIGELLGRLKSGESGSVWGDLQGCYGDLSAALRSGDQAGFQGAVTRLGTLIQQGGRAEETWKDLYEAIEGKTKVAAREWKRMVDLHQVITAERALALVTAIMQSVVRHVPDAHTRSLISSDVRSLIFTVGGKGEPEAPGHQPENI